MMCIRMLQDVCSWAQSPMCKLVRSLSFLESISDSSCALYVLSSHMKERKYEAAVAVAPLADAHRWVS